MGGELFGILPRSLNAALYSLAPPPWPSFLKPRVQTASHAVRSVAKVTVPQKHPPTISYLHSLLYPSRSAYQRFNSGSGALQRSAARLGRH